MRLPQILNRQQYPESAAILIARIERKCSTMLLDDTVCHAQAESGAFAVAFSGEEWSKDMLMQVLGNTGPRIGHYN